MHVKTEKLAGIAVNAPLSDHFNNPHSFQAAINAAFFRAKKLDLPVLVVRNESGYAVFRHGQALGKYWKGRAEMSAVEVDTDGRATRVTVSKSPQYSI